MTIVNDMSRPTTTFAWLQIEEGNGKDGNGFGQITWATDWPYIYLAVAELSDRALASPDGLSWIDPNDVARLARLDIWRVREALTMMSLSKMLRSRPNEEDGAADGYRFPEEAYT